MEPADEEPRPPLLLPGRWIGGLSQGGSVGLSRGGGLSSHDGVGSLSWRGAGGCGGGEFVFPGGTGVPGLEFISSY